MSDRTPIQLSDHFGYRRLIRFTLPAIASMIFTSVYGVVDGVFVSNFAGETAFAAVNLIMPYLMVLFAFGLLLGVGGSARVSVLLGEGRNEEANSLFCLIVCVTAGLGAVFALISMPLLPTVAGLFGAEGQLLKNCVLYARVYVLGMPAFLLQANFQSFLITAERPKLGLAFTVSAGVANMILDAVFVAWFRWGLAGAAAATVIGQCIGGLGPVIYFFAAKKSPLKLMRFRPSLRELRRALSCGLAEFFTNISTSVVSIAYNTQLLRLIGEYGVSAYGILMYVGFIFSGTFMGYAMGVMPVLGYHYGAGDHDELHSLVKKSMVLVMWSSFLLTGLAEAGARVFAGIFAGYDADLLALSTKAMRLYATNYLLSGYNIFIANLFASLNNGRLSAAISFLRVFVLQLLCVFLVPAVLGIDGIWLAITAAELLTAFVTFTLLVKNRARYHY